MKLFSKNRKKKSGLVPFDGTPHVNSQRHLRGFGRFFSKKEMEARAAYMMSINYLYTRSRFMSPGVKDQLEITKNSGPLGW